MSPEEVLEKAMRVRIAKSKDYQSLCSTVTQAQYYPRGIETIYDIMWGKMLRIKSIMEATKNANGINHPQYESIQDSALDLINYASFLSAYMDHDIEGQSIYQDVFNQNIEGPSITCEIE